MQSVPINPQPSRRRAVSVSIPQFGARAGGRYSAGGSASEQLEVDAWGTGGRSGDAGFANGG